jgi:triacylglycerol lipase
MWLSQLAYEARDQAQKIDPILRTWRSRQLALFRNMKVDEFPLTATNGLIAAGHGATIIAFTGTDPLELANWLTNFNLGPRARELHAGFEAGVDAVWREISDAVRARAADEQTVFLTGHSLGGALAVIAAERLTSKLHIMPAGVYTFGMPRVGSADFAASYNGSGLGERTYRFVYGVDVVPTVPPTAFAFHHVGRMTKCDRGGSFAPDALSPADSDDPPFLGNVEGVKQAMASLLGRNILPSFRPDWLGSVYKWLIPVIGDHLPDRYCHALGRVR